MRLKCSRWREAFESANHDVRKYIIKTYLFIAQHDCSAMNIPCFPTWIRTSDKKVRFPPSVWLPSVLGLALPHCFCSADDGGACGYWCNNSEYHDDGSRIQYALGHCMIIDERRRRSPSVRGILLEHPACFPSSSPLNLTFYRMNIWPLHARRGMTSLNIFAIAQEAYWMRL